jgi:hypothetical protein
MLNIRLKNSHTKKRSIKIFLQGGVGNQLFQYYFARYAITKLKKQSILNTSLINSTNLSHQNSNILSLNLIIPIDNKIINLKLFYKFILNYFPKINSNLHLKKSILKVFTDSEIGYNKNIDDVIINGDYKYILGYFQSWKYCELNSIEKKTLFNGFNYKDPWILNNYKIMSTTKFTAVHIRLGDYMLHKNNFIGVLPQEYYNNCIQYLDSKNLSQKYYIFSDQIDIAETLYGTLFPKDSIWVNSSKNCNPLEILSIMSLANVFIIANSTFSWWAANLGADNSLVLAPNKWFKNAPDPLDLLPPTWNLIETGWSQL